MKLLFSFNEYDLAAFINLVATQSIAKNTTKKCLLGLSLDEGQIILQYKQYEIQLVSSCSIEGKSEEGSYEFSFDQLLLPFRSSKDKDSRVEIWVDTEKQTISARNKILSLEELSYNPRPDIKLKVKYNADSTPHVCFNSAEIKKASISLKSIALHGSIFTTKSLNRFLSADEHCLVRIDLFDEEDINPFDCRIKGISPANLATLCDFADSSLDFCEKYVIALSETHQSHLSMAYSLVESIEYQGFDEMEMDEILQLTLTTGDELNQYLKLGIKLTDIKLPVACLETSDSLSTIRYFKDLVEVAHQQINLSYEKEEDSNEEGMQQHFFFDPKALSTFLTKIGNKKPATISFSETMLSVKSAIQGRFPKVTFYILLYQVVEDTD